MLKNLKPHELKPGMFVVSHGTGSFDDPVVKVERLILSTDVARYVPEHTGLVVVDTERSVEVAELPARERRDRLAAAPLAALEEELPVAARLYSQAVALAHELLDRVRAGKSFDHHQALPLIAEMRRSIERNETATSWARLRRIDDYTYAHCANVAVLAMLLGRHMGFPPDEVERLGLAGFFHDVGKARIPEEILNKPGKLSEPEMEVMRRHALEGYLVMKDQQGVPPQVLRAILEHHERTDGQGYPYHLAGQDISLFSQVVAVVDVYDALTSEKVYRRAVAPATALSMLFQWRNKSLCGECIEVLIRALGIYPVGSFVQLSNGEYGVVSEINRRQPLNPKVRVVFDARMRPQRMRLMDLAVQPRNGPEPLTVLECLNPVLYKLDISRYLA